MRFFKLIENGYILGIGKGNIGEEIAEDEYNAIIAKLSEKPQRTETIDYRLKEDLTWESYEVEPTPPMPEPEPTSDEILDIFMGVN